MCHQTSQFSGQKTGLGQADAHCQLIECEHIQNSPGETNAIKTEFFELLEVKCFISLINLPITKSFQNKQICLYSCQVLGEVAQAYYRIQYLFATLKGSNFFSLTSILYWGIVYLQCVSFRCTAKWFSYTYTNIHSFSDSFPIQVITEY